MVCYVLLSRSVAFGIARRISYFIYSVIRCCLHLENRHSLSLFQILISLLFPFVCACGSSFAFGKRASIDKRSRRRHVTQWIEGIMDYTRSPIFFSILYSVCENMNANLHAWTVWKKSVDFSPASSYGCSEWQCIFTMNDSNEYFRRK